MRNAQQSNLGPGGKVPQRFMLIRGRAAVLLQCGGGTAGVVRVMSTIAVHVSKECVLLETNQVDAKGPCCAGCSNVSPQLNLSTNNWNVGDYG